MERLNSSIIIGLPIEKVYKVAETYPTFVKSYDVKTIIKNNEDQIVVDVGYRFFGLCVCWSGVGQKTKYKSINYIQTKGFLKGMEANWSFDSLGNRTQVSIDIKIKRPLFFLVRFIKKRISKIINGILSDLKDAVERKES